MKKVYSSFLFACLFSGILASCGESKQETTSEQKDSVATTQDAPSPSALARYGTRLQEIVQNEQGVLRGISFGDDSAKVKRTETATLKEDSTDHLGYTVELGNYEDLDVRYHLNPQQKVWGFTLDIYLDKQTSVDSLLNDFKGYFTDRFGPYNFDNQHNMVAWNLPDSTKIVVKDVGIKQAPGLQVQILDYKKAQGEILN